MCTNLPTILKLMCIADCLLCYCSFRRSYLFLTQDILSNRPIQLLCWRLMLFKGLYSWKEWSTERRVMILNKAAFDSNKTAFPRPHVRLRRRCKHRPLVVGLHAARQLVSRCTSDSENGEGAAAATCKSTAGARRR